MVLVYKNRVLQVSLKKKYVPCTFRNMASTACTSSSTQVKVF